MADKTVSWRLSYQVRSVLLKIRRALLKGGEDSTVTRVYRLARRIPGVHHAWRFIDLRSSAADPERILAFWREHGREWASREALPQDLAVVASLSERVHGLGAHEREADVTAALRKIWAEGFSNPDDAFPWDGMNDGLRPAALLAFVEGAGSVWKEKWASP